MYHPAAVPSLGETPIFLGKLVENMRPQPTWASYARWHKWSVLLAPIWCIGAAALLIISGLGPASVVCTAIAVVGLAWLPVNVARYRRARRHVLAGDPDPEDVRDLRAQLRG